MSDNPKGITPQRLARSAYWANQLQQVIYRLLKSDTAVQHICADGLAEEYMLCAMVQAGAMDMTVPNADGSNPFDNIDLKRPEPQIVSELPEWMKEMGVKEETEPRTVTGADLMHRTTPNIDNAAAEMRFEREERERRQGGRPPIPGIRTERTMNTAENKGPHYHIVIHDENNRIISVAKPVDWQLAAQLVSTLSQQKEHLRHRIRLQPGLCQGDGCPQVEVVPAIEHVKGLGVIQTPHWAIEAAQRILRHQARDGEEGWVRDAANLIAQEFVRMQSIIFYGPHKCDLCGLGLIARGDIQGGNGNLRFDYPSGPTYPNTPWRTHQCHTFKVDPDGYFGQQPVTNGQDFETPPINAGCNAPPRPSSQPDGHAADDRN